MKGKSKPKSNDIEFQARIETVASLLSKFYTRREIIQYVSKKTDWNVVPRQIDNYIADAKKWLKEQVNEDDIKAKISNEFGYLYKKNLSVDDYKECRALLESFAKLYGISAPQKLDLTTQGEKIGRVSDVFGFEDEKNNPK